MSLFIVGQFFGPWRGKSFQTIITGYRTVEGTRIREKRYLNVEVDVRSNGTMMKRLGRSEIIPKRRVRMILVPLHQLSQREKLQRIESISLSLFYPLASLLSSFSRLCILSFFFLCFLLEWKINNLKALKVEVFNGDRADWFVWFFFSDGDWCVWFFFCRSSYFQLDYFIEEREIEIWGWDRNFKLSMFRSFPRILWKLSILIDVVQVIRLIFNSKIFLIEMRGRL